MNAKTAIDFSKGKFSDSSLSIKAGEIIDKTKGNENFKDAEDLLGDVVKSLDDFNDALFKRLSGGREATVNKQITRKNLENRLKLLAQHIQMESVGDERKILSSGFEVHRKPTRIGILPKPDKLIVKPGRNEGEVILTCSHLPDVRLYEFKYTETPVNDKSVWITHTHSKSSLRLTNLKSGCQYAFRVAGAGTSPVRVWSEQVISYVL